MDSDLKIIQECGFNSFEEVVKRINELINVMRTGRTKAEQNLQRFNNQAKEYLKAGQKDKAKKELAKKKKKDERIKAFDTQFKVILEKLNEVKNSNQMLQVLNATKYCNNVLLSELKESENEGETETKEYQDLMENDKEIRKYLEIMVKSIKKPEKVKPKIPQTIPTNYNNLDFNNNNINISNKDLILIQKCGFNTFGDAIRRINDLVNIMRLGRIKIEQNLEKFVNQAKDYLRGGQKDAAKKELAKKKQKEEKIKTFDTQYNTIIEKIKEIKGCTQIVQVLNEMKNSNNDLIEELKESENEETKEFQDLMENDKEINKYLEIINSFNNNYNQGEGFGISNNNNDFDNYNQFNNFPSDSI